MFCLLLLVLTIRLARPNTSKTISWPKEYDEEKIQPHSDPLVQPSATLSRRLRPPKLLKLCRTAVVRAPKSPSQSGAILNSICWSYGELRNIAHTNYLVQQWLPQKLAVWPSESIFGGQSTAQMQGVAAVTSNAQLCSSRTATTVVPNR